MNILKFIISLIFVSQILSAGVSLQLGKDQAEAYRNVEEGRYFEEQNKTQNPAVLAQEGSAYVAAFYSMKEVNPKAKIYMIVKGISKSNLVGMEALEGGTLLLITQKSGKQEVIKVADIEKLSQW